MKILKKLLSGNTLYYPGCLTKFVAVDLEKRYEKILRLEGIDFIKLASKESCCGSPAKKAGAEGAFRKVAQDNLAVFRDHGIGKIISNCPACVNMLQNEYRQLLGEDWDMEVLHSVQVMKKSLAKIRKTGAGKRATYHDPCHLGKALGIYEEPRAIIRKAGYELVEMEMERSGSFCCGAGAGVRNNNPELAGRISADRGGQAKAVGATTMITACPMCFLHLKQHNPDLEVLELSMLFEL